MPEITLTQEQENQLKELTQSKSAQIMHRAHLILAYAEGKPTLQAAKQAGISRGRARYWKRQFNARGMEVFESGRDEELPQVIEIQTINPIEAELIQAVDQAHQVTIEAKVALAWPVVQKTIGLMPDDSLAEAGKKVWLYHFAIMLSHEQGTLVGEDIEELHDMRVATRRMRSAFDVFGPAYEAKTLQRHQKGLRAIGRALGQVRDLDVLLGNVIQYQAKLREPERSGINPLVEAWRQIISTKRVKLIKHMQGESYQRFKTNFNIFLQTSEKVDQASTSGIEAMGRIRDIVPVILYNRYAQVKAYDAIVPKASVEQLHALRIEFKRFRYAMEYFKEILGESTGKAINEIKQYQDHLGELHDADVACQLVRDYLKEWDERQAQTPIPERQNPQPVVTYMAYLHAERYRLMVAFPELWLKFNRVEFRQNLAQIISKL